MHIVLILDEQGGVVVLSK